VIEGIFFPEDKKYDQPYYGKENAAESSSEISDTSPYRPEFSPHKRHSPSVPTNPIDIAEESVDSVAWLLSQEHGNEIRTIGTSRQLNPSNPRHVVQSANSIATKSFQIHNGKQFSTVITAAMIEFVN
jgi:hypothetical protein